MQEQTMKELLKGLTSADLRCHPDFYQVKPDGKTLDSIAAQLGTLVFGQERACRETARAMMRSLGGFCVPDRPEFSAMFAGPPGVGKTEMGRAIARYHDEKDFENRLLVIDCANFAESHDIHKIIGAPPSYVGYGDKPLITPDFLAKPNVIVFDELEKAHAAVDRMCLAILDKGRLQVPIGESTYRNVKNETLNFCKSTILFTTNAGSGEMQRAQEGKGGLGFVRTNADQDIYGIGIKAIRDMWKVMPEFLNRLDAIIIFDALKPPVLRRILDKFLDQYNDNQRFPVFLALTDELKNHVISKVDTKYGGREVRRLLEKLVITPAAEVKFDMPTGTHMIADLADDNEVAFWLSKSDIEKGRDEQKEAEDVKKNESCRGGTDIRVDFGHPNRRRRGQKRRRH